MKTFQRRIYLSFYLSVLLVSLTACGGGTFIKSFRVALAASGPLVNSLVASGAIPQSKASDIIRDFNDGAQCAQTLQTAFSAIPKDDPDANRLKLSASVNAMRCWRVIVNRQNFALNPRIQQAADIADGILASMVVFYSEDGVMVNEVGRPTAKARDEKDLEKQMKEKIKELEAKLTL